MKANVYWPYYKYIKEYKKNNLLINKSIKNYYILKHYCLNPIVHHFSNMMSPNFL